MKVLFINLPYHGHVVPTVGLVQELTRLGCQVTYLLPFDWEDRIAGSGAEFYGYKNHRQLAEQMKNAWAAADGIAAQFDLVLYEQFFFLGKHLAEKHGKPAVRVFTAPVANRELMEKYIAKGPLSVFRCKWIARAFTKDIARKIPLKTDNWLDEIVENPPELNLVYTLRQYQPYESAFPETQYRFLGPSVYDRGVEVLEFVKGDRPMVYISLGTVIKGAASFFQTCVEAFRDGSVDVVLSVGEKFDRRKLKNLPENIYVFPSVPQTEMLKMADVFVTHGGMNSVSEALVCGCPMVVIPFGSDQPVNARCVERLGVGKQLEYAAVNKDNLKAAVCDLVGDRAVRANLERVRAWIAESPGNKGGAEAVLRYYEAVRGR